MTDIDHTVTIRFSKQPHEYKPNLCSILDTTYHTTTRQTFVKHQFRSTPTDILHRFQEKIGDRQNMKFYIHRAESWATWHVAVQKDSKKWYVYSTLSSRKRYPWLNFQLRKKTSHNHTNRAKKPFRSFPFIRNGSVKILLVTTYSRQIRTSRSEKLERLTRNNSRLFRSSSLRLEKANSKSSSVQNSTLLVNSTLPLQYARLTYLHTCILVYLPPWCEHYPFPCPKSYSKRHRLPPEASLIGVAGDVGATYFYDLYSNMASTFPVQNRISHIPSPIFHLPSPIFHLPAETMSTIRMIFVCEPRRTSQRAM